MPSNLGVPSVRLLILAPYPLDRAPSQRFRFERYLAPLRTDGWEVDVRSFMDRETYARFHRRGGAMGKAAALVAGAKRRWRDTARAGEWDVVLIHREAFPAGGPVFERRVAGRGTPIVFDFDDAIWLPNVSAANRRARWLKHPEKTASIIGLSRVVLAGNEYLADYARALNPDVRVLPTVVDTESYVCTDGPSEGPVTVGWTGSVTTLEHLRMLEPVLARIQREKEVAIRIVGAPDYRPTGFEAEVIAWDPAREVEDLCPIDIGLMPLPDEPWARGKCGLKLLQYMALGRAAVASPVGVNTRIVQDGVNGLLARTPPEWEGALRDLLDDPALRARLGRAARSTVEREYSVEATYPMFVRALEDAAG